MAMLALVLLFWLSPKAAFCQINFPRISPSAKIEQRIGLTDLTIEYSRPGARNRQVMGHLVPYGRIWRVGANESTKLILSDSISINALPLPKGSYALYAFPDSTEWIIILHKNTTHWGDGRDKYNAEEDALRFKVKPIALPYFQETFEISFDSITHQSAIMLWSWEKTQIRIPISVNTHAKVMAEIGLQIQANPTAETYYQSARYLQEQGIQFEKAQQWLQKAHDLAGDRYYIHRVRSLVEAELGNLEKAIAYAEKSKAIAASLGKDEFVRMNEENIQKWTKLLKDE